ncbi:hypothetical protein [Flavobacterium terrae]|uniref:Uncharacterized protein n=1 Tax=Flavobacterium terrae TaxID=415425 RepID=A0A1M6BBH4_9FLAO|nr:hypothetical protein [Flavobacterium terrae]SHI46079.1 hypothetical protein SAMN05444363_0657 [Flavobacterium terrae]
MNTNEDKHIEKLIDKMMKDQTLEAPSFDFTSKVMNQVLESKKDSVFTYKPLLSKQTSFIILSIVIGIVIYAVFSNASISEKWTLPIDFSVIYKNKFSQMLNFSTITTYSTVVGTIMLLLQVYYLRNHFANRN